MNDNLKVIGRMIGTKKRMTFHISRHTFGTLFLEANGKVEVLQKLMDSSNIRTTIRYAHITYKRKEDQMRLLG